MVKSRIFDNTQLLKEHPELPHYKEEVVCFRSEYKDRSYPANECYFNRELYMIFVLEGRSEILLNGEFIAIEYVTYSRSKLSHGTSLFKSGY